MAHDVFISHSARDKPFADAVCAKLESRGIRCWIAPRDIRPGMEWGAAILEAIDGARVMLLVFSSNANGSPQISREVERAVHKQVVVVPVRVEDVMPTGNLEYFLGTPHWLDAVTPPFEQHLEGIADSASFWLERLGTAAPGAIDARTTQPTPLRPDIVAPGRERSRAKWIIPAAIALVIAALGGGGFFATRYYLAQQNEARNVAPQPVPIVPPPRENQLAQEGDRQTAKAAAAAEANKKKPEGGAGQSEPQIVPAQAAAVAQQQTGGKIFRDCEDCPEMVVLPSGSFMMGSSEPNHISAEGPQHRVTISYALAVGLYPVTHAEYARFVSETKWVHFDPPFAQTERDPVVNINWNGAKAYVLWLSKKTGHSYRLLSESEYEYAERAGTTTDYWWGKEWICSYANIGVCGSKLTTIPVGSHPANAFGLYEMAGNVSEWTEDCWHDSYDDAPVDGTAWTTGNCDQRVARGGSYTGTDTNLRSANRELLHTTYGGFEDVGFRVARTL